jgi:hypothetical protein
VDRSERAGDGQENGGAQVAQEARAAQGPVAPQPTTPHVTVVVCTFNRADRVGTTVRAVLAQEGPSFELVVVDDGSTDTTPEVLAALADERLRVVRQRNAGLGAARNAGLAAARGAWVVFLDDDDVPDPGWLAGLAGPTGDDAVGITCVGAIAVDPAGAEICPLPVDRLPQPFGGVEASYLAGTFAVRTDLCRAAGGYLDGLGISHQFELFLRLQDEARRRELGIAVTPVNLLRIEWRDVGDRTSSDPHIIYDATSWVLVRHPERFAGQHQVVASFEGIRGTAAARLGDWRLARRHFRAQARLAPRARRNWLRLGLACVPALGRRTWDRHHSGTYRASTVGIVVQHADHPDTPGPARELFLPATYRENPGPSSNGAAPGAGADRAPAAAAPVRRLARRLARRTPGLLVHLHPGLETADDPVVALRALAGRAGDAPVLLAVADRAATDPDRPSGPPSDPGHRREWTEDQIRLLLRSTGFGVRRTWRRSGRVLVLARRFDEPPARIN